MAVQTVLGAVDPEDLGRTLTHEHLLLDFQRFLVPPPLDLSRFLEGDISLNNIGFIQRYPYSSRTNLSFFTEETKEAVLRDVHIFKGFGGGTIVENTVHGLKRNVKFMEEVSRKTGIHVVAGTGYYVADVQNEGVLSKSVEELTKEMKSELTQGCADHPSVRCGFIGEIASNFPIHSFERKVIQAVGVLQEELKCPVSFHPGRHNEAPGEILRLYTEAGGNPKKAVMSHLDRTFKEFFMFFDLSEDFECYLQQDLFGNEVLVYQFDRDFPMPSDVQRIQTLKYLIEDGFAEKVLVSHDIHTKHRLLEFGGHGYCHLFRNVVPRMLKEGISQSAIDEITINNPKRWLTWEYP